jgi:hypothetical protein
MPNWPDYRAGKALILTSFEAVITVPGWLMSNGQLWLSLIGGPPCKVTLNSPMIYPSNTTSTTTQNSTSREFSICRTILRERALSCRCVFFKA